MDFVIEDTRKRPTPALKELIEDGIVTFEEALDWLRSIYEIRFFEEKVFELLGLNIIKGASHLYAGEEAIASQKSRTKTISAPPALSAAIRRLQLERLWLKSIKKPAGSSCRSLGTARQIAAASMNQ